MKKIVTLLCTALLTTKLFAQVYTVLGTGAQAINPKCFINQITTDGNGNLYAACGYVMGGLDYGLVEKWNGTTWAELSTAGDSLNANGDVRTVAVDGNNNIYAAGDFNDLSGAETGGIYVAEWNAGIWNEVNSVSNPHINNGSVFALTCDTHNNLYATQYSDTGIGANPYSYVAEWNGTNWNPLGTGANMLAQDSTFLTITHDAANNIYVAGQFVDSNNYKYVAKWNGTEWSELGTGSHALNANGNILAVATDDAGNVYAAGVFTNAGGNPYIAKWDGTNWTDLDNSAQAFEGAFYYYGITSLAVAGNIVYAAGGFKDSAYYVAVYDPLSGWVRYHTDTVIFSQLTAGASGLYGAYSGVNYIGQLAYGFVAQLSLPIAFGIEPVNANNNITLYPNPTNNVLHITCNTNATQVEAFNVLGQRVAYQQGNAIQLLNVSALASGAYIIRVTDEAGNVALGRFCKE